METTESAPVKRRLNEGDVASQQRPIQEDQGQWRVAGPKKVSGCRPPAFVVAFSRRRWDDALSVSLTLRFCS
ncbi:hypothetical protein MTO96_048829 [Rhipicephalus appendiculatus]